MICSTPPFFQFVIICSNSRKICPIVKGFAQQKKGNTDWILLSLNNNNRSVDTHYTHVEKL